jgi:hypothetical protein
MIPGSDSPIDQLTVTVRDADNNPIPNCEVRILFDGCARLCIDSSPDLGPKNAGADGRVVFNPRVGGCDFCDIRLIANGIAIRHYSTVRSPDWNGVLADGRVAQDDVDFISGQDNLPCADLNGDGFVGAADLTIVAASFGDANPNGLCHVGATESGPSIRDLALRVPYPNPTRGDVMLGIHLPAGGMARLEILDVGGRRIAQIASGRFEEGDRTFVWTAADGDADLPNGVYLVRLQTPWGVRSAPIVLER